MMIEIEVYPTSILAKYKYRCNKFSDRFLQINCGHQQKKIIFKITSSVLIVFYKAWVLTFNIN